MNCSSRVYTLRLTLRYTLIPVVLPPPLPLPLGLGYLNALLSVNTTCILNHYSLSEFKLSRLLIWLEKYYLFILFQMHERSTFSVQYNIRKKSLSIVLFSNSSS